MGRDFRAELAGTATWDHTTSALFAQTGVPAQDRVLQSMDELVGLCEWIEAHDIRSYLEIGVWTGRLVSLLHGLFRFDKVAAADICWARHVGLQIRVPFGCAWYEGDSRSVEFVQWRAQQGHFDLVLIDGDHSYEGVAADFEIQRRMPHSWLALHDVAGFHPSTEGVKQLWGELEGEKVEIIRPHRELELPISTMGIGLWRAQG